MADGVVFALHVTPRSSRPGIEGVDDDGRLRVRVSAAPVDGAANEALVALLAAELGVRRSAVTLASGASSRHKRVRVDGLEADSLRARWPGLLLEGRSPS